MLSAASRPFDFLDGATIPTHVIFDWVRFVAALVAFALVLPNLRIAFGRERPEESQGHRVVVTIRIGVMAFVAMLIPIALTELEQIGKPLVVWRLPLVIVADVLGWWYAVRRL